VTSTPAVDIAESDKAYEITAELPGMDEKKIEVKVERRLDHQGREEGGEGEGLLHLRTQLWVLRALFPRPRRSRHRKIEANLKNGVLKVVLPKKAEAQKPEKKVEIKAAA
jgi:HSP20 family protein